MTGKMHWRYPLFFVLVLNVTVMLQAIPLPAPIADGDYITYIGPIQLINTGQTTDTEQVLRIVGSVQSAIENMIGNKPGVNLEISLGNQKIETSSIQPAISEPASVAQEETTTATLVDTTVVAIESTTTAAPTEPPQERMIATETANPVVTNEELAVTVTASETAPAVPATEKKHVVTVVEMSNQTLIYVYDPLTVPTGMEPWRAHESSGARILGSTQQESSTSAAEIVTEVTVQTEPITVIATTEATTVAAVNEVTTEKPGAASMVNWLIKCLLSSDSTKTAGTTTNEKDSSSSTSSSWSSSWSNLNPAGSVTVSHESPTRSTNVRGARKPSSSSTSWSNLDLNWTPKTEPIQEVMNEFEPRKIGKGNRNSHVTVQSNGRKQSNSVWNEEQPHKITRTEQRFINEPFVHFGSRPSGRKARKSTSSE